MEQEATAGLRLTKDEADVMAELSEGPLRVISVDFDMSATCPIRSQSRTWLAVYRKRAPNLFA